MRTLNSRWCQRLARAAIEKWSRFDGIMLCTHNAMSFQSWEERKSEQKVYTLSLRTIFSTWLLIFCSYFPFIAVSIRERQHLLVRLCAQAIRHSIRCGAEIISLCIELLSRFAVVVVVVVVARSWVRSFAVKILRWWEFNMSAADYVQPAQLRIPATEHAFRLFRQPALLLLLFIVCSCVLWLHRIALPLWAHSTIIICQKKIVPDCVFTKIIIIFLYWALTTLSIHRVTDLQTALIAILCIFIYMDICFAPHLSAIPYLHV